ncbi:MAG: (2Fe-2S) ferredoxin domain-containing protein [Nitrospinaceae bacterium]|nr:(2Fe-2S) ferredoxin domain-containing protein [Nitrospinaceae bacterium]MBT3433642.1 (2Fe-2S) ferredoxin domain-containing protein [Nitrospinaceae bacterium]MBT3823252.1 (2Fe-2S) ferredoxin domain-containing protein [Nitrospinaceae bacterium]MBT4093826.1 (2Fe-2S) ferredoxin domain-containing protein [Nitrospinaceae bacterium]MBT4430767.1 (2Fe-2S) ferredoxin domain-containing protein [Nitrospinaceae bacterium]
MHAKKRYVLVCTNERAEDHPKGSCGRCGSVEVRERIKDLIAEKGLKSKARTLKTTCLDICSSGPIICVMPDNVWYEGVRVEDAEEIVDSHLDRGEPVERLLIPEAPTGFSMM